MSLSPALSNIEKKGGNVKIQNFVQVAGTNSSVDNQVNCKLVTKSSVELYFHFSKSWTQRKVLQLILNFKRGTGGAILCPEVLQNKKHSILFATILRFPILGRPVEGRFRWLSYSSYNIRNSSSCDFHGIEPQQVCFIQTVIETLRVRTWVCALWPKITIE